MVLTRWILFRGNKMLNWFNEIPFCHDFYAKIHAKRVFFQIAFIAGWHPAIKIFRPAGAVSKIESLF